MNERKILVIEDEPEMRRNLVTILKLEKFLPLAAENGRAGLELARIALTELLERLNAVPPPRRGPRRRPQPKAPPKAQASPDAPAAPVPAEPAVPDPPPARKPRRKPEPSDSGSFGPLFDLL